ncbi:MAG: cell division protein FtsA [bacterium]|nr:cell division protein FtsA [bacterium]
MKRKDGVIVGIDIGTTRICVAVGEETEAGLDIIGVGTHPSQGVRRGVVVDSDAAAGSIKQAIEQAEAMSGCEITSAYAGISGSHIQSFNSHGIVAVKDREVRDGDVRRVIDVAKATSIPMDREVIHVIPQEFILDDQDGIREPLGMTGVRLEVKVHIVTAHVTAAQQVTECCNRAGINVADVVLGAGATASSVLSDDERELGVCMLDIGGGTTDIAVFGGGSVKHTSVLDMGACDFSEDIAANLGTSFEVTDRCKEESSFVSVVDSADVADLTESSVGGDEEREVARHAMRQTIDARAGQVLTEALSRLSEDGFDDRNLCGVVLTGGGAELAGLLERAEKEFGLPTRIGSVIKVSSSGNLELDPTWATAVGLALFGTWQQRTSRSSRFRIRDESIFGRVKQRMRDWFFAEFD